MGTSSKSSCKTAAVMALLGKGKAEGREPGDPAEAQRSGFDGERRRSGADEPSPQGESSERSLGRRVPNLDTTNGREQIEYIDIDRLDDDPSNFYELSGLDELAANIELLGLQQPIRVRPGTERGRYVIVSGHRRRAAVRQLVMDGHGELRDLPCIVERGQESAALQELRLIYANSDTRKMTPAEISRQAERVEALLYQLKEEGYEFPGRMRDHVAEACKVSKSKLARLKVIRENLDKQWRPAYERGRLSESAAYTLAQMPAERQQIIYNGLAKQGRVPGAVQEYSVRQYGESLAQAEAVECRTYGNGPCLNREAMRERIMRQDSWPYNYCRQCCGECEQLAKCKDACPMLADKVKQLKADAMARREQKKQAQEEQSRSEVEAIRQLWKRFGQARAAAGKSVNEYLDAAGCYCYPDDQETYEMRERLEGKFDRHTSLPYSPGCSAGTIQALVGGADLLGVSLDYLLCRTDDPAGLPQPEGQLVISGWMPGGTLPFQPCDVVADLDLGNGGTIRQSCRFDGRIFCWEKSGAPIEANVVRWMALPPVEDLP